MKTENLVTLLGFLFVTLVFSSAIYSDYKVNLKILDCISNAKTLEIALICDKIKV